MQNTKLYLIQIHQTVRGTFANFFKEAKVDGDMEIIDGWTERILRERGFRFTTLEVGFA